MIDELTEEEQTAQYLQENPHVECGLWTEWVGVVCGWEKIDTPTQAEWQVLRSNFYSGKTPVESVDELKKLRTK